MRADWSVELLAVRGSFSLPDALWGTAGKIFKLKGVSQSSNAAWTMPLASDARPRGHASDTGNGALRWRAPVVGTKRPESGRKEEDSHGRTRDERRASSSSATSSGPGEGSDAAVRSSTEEGFNIALVELAAEMERELALERTGDKPRTAIGSFIKKFRGDGASSPGGADGRGRGEGGDRGDDAPFWWRDPSATSPSPDRSLRDGLGDVVLAASPVLGQSPSLDRSGFSEGWRSEDSYPSDEMLSELSESSMRRTRRLARAREEVGLSTEDSLSSLEAWRRSDDYAHLIADDVERVDILEQWRRRRRLEAATKGADASHAARAAAAVAALDAGSDLDREAIEKIAAAAAAKVSVEEAEAATLRAEAEAATLRAEAEDDDAAEDAARAGNRPPPAAERSSPSKSREDAPPAAARSPEPRQAASSPAKGKARRSLEFGGGAEDDGADVQNDGTDVQNDGADVPDSASESSSMHTPAGSPRANHPSASRRDMMLGDMLGDTVGDVLFGDGPAASAPLMVFPTTAAVVAQSAKPPARPAPAKPPRSPPAGAPSPAIDAPSPPPSPARSPESAALPRPPPSSSGPSSSSSSGSIRRPARLPPVHRPPLPKQKAERYQPPRESPSPREPLSPIEMVAAEVPPRPPRPPPESPPESPKAADAFEHSPTRHPAAASAAVADLAATASNPWLPARMQTGSASVHRPTAAVRGDAPPGWLGDEWAAPEDEDDGLVVMLKARIENLQGQLARYDSS